ncbi:hypothetical protein B2J93_5464 [Marssonina coronariae]|uniref:Uncharacterized protein n=1 Tax=Diplocarpon coronariae TaxID=2795749 RepID=A0A218Z0F7_9HELO|nr:hypothetical protein B2J93_5464 [Marssonina coronariae]
MAFAIGGASVPSLPGLMPGLLPRVPPAPVPLSPAPATLHRRQNGTAPSPAARETVNLFIDSTDADWEYAASIIAACADQTVYAVQCTSGGDLVGAQTCGPNAVFANGVRGWWRAQKATLTAGTSTYRFSSDLTTTTLGVEVTATAEESCLLAGTTAATCTATVKATADGTRTTTTTRATLSGTAYYRYDVAITGGAEKTATAAATCGGGGGSDTKGAGATVRPRGVLLWAVAGVAVAGATGVLSMFGGTLI